MSVFFNGRLWTTPVTVSKVDDSAMYNRNPAVGNVLAIIGRSEGGKPNTALRFGSPEEARATLRSGELLDAIRKAFDPSAQTGGPSEIVAIRVNPATVSSLALKDGSNNTVITLDSTDYGLYTGQIKVKIESGTNAGKKLTTQFGNDYYTADDVARNAFSVRYSGAQATARMSVTGTTLTLEAPNSTAVATIDLATYPTVQQVVDRINVVSGFAAAVLEGNGLKPTLNGLDYVSNQDVKSATYTATANLQAVVDWFNGLAEGFVTAAREAGVGAVPANLDWTYLSGGGDGTVTNTEWQAAFTALQAEDVQWVVPLSSSSSIHAMADTHCQFMSTVARMERRAIVGGASGATDAAAIAAARALNSDRISYTHVGFYDYDDSGALVLREPYILAALLGGMAAGSNPGTPLTNKTLKARGLERKLRNPVDTDPLILGGVLAVEDTPNGYKVVKSVTTWTTDSRYNRVEMSTGAATDFVARSARQAIDNLRGQKMSPSLLGLAVEQTETALRELARPEPSGPGILVGDAESPPYRNIVASIEGDVLRVEFECSPAIPCNYVLITIHAVPYSGTATAASFLA